MALIADIKRNALDDGPGIRSTVFYIGCPLRCVWCQNPETMTAAPQLQHRQAACIACGRCAEACPAGAVAFTGGRRQRDAAACAVCGQCAEQCPPGGLRVVGRQLCAEQLVDRLLLDEPFFRHSGGGVTFSGGEPTLYLDHLERVAAGLKQRAGVHLVLETCGFYRAAHLERRLLPLLDLVYFDLKLVDPARHRRRTGRGNRIILANLGRLARQHPHRLLVRVPLVPGITDDPENLRATARLLRGMGLRRVALLPYNPLWIAKRADLGLPSTGFAHARMLTEQQLQTCRQLMREQGLELY